MRLAGPKDGAWLILNEIWKFKMEIPDKEKCVRPLFAPFSPLFARFSRAESSYEVQHALVNAVWFGT